MSVNRDRPSPKRSVRSLWRFAKMRQHFVVLLILLSGFSIVSATPTAYADHLELRNGQILQGKFLAGSNLNIRFQVDGKEQIFATKDVLNIGFDEGTPEAATSVPGASVLPSSSTPVSSPAPAADPNAGSAVPTSAATANAITVP